MKKSVAMKWVEALRSGNKKLVSRSTFTDKGCFEWRGAKNGDGYGYLLHNRFNWRVHRLAWTLVNGDIPKGLLICHKCDNRICINPDHLFLGTLADNNKDRAAKGRNRDQHGEKNTKAKLNWKAVHKIRSLMGTGLYQHEVADQFKVSQTLIGKIWRNEYWKES